MLGGQQLLTALPGFRLSIPAGTVQGAWPLPSLAGSTSSGFGLGQCQEPRAVV